MLSEKATKQVIEIIKDDVNKNSEGTEKGITGFAINIDYKEGELPKIELGIKYIMLDGTLKRQSFEIQKEQEKHQFLVLGHYALFFDYKRRYEFCGVKKENIKSVGKLKRGVFIIASTEDSEISEIYYVDEKLEEVLKQLEVQNG